jgi:hypothetical protein
MATGSAALARNPDPAQLRPSRSDRRSRRLRRTSPRLLTRILAIAATLLLLSPIGAEAQTIPMLSLEAAAGRGPRSDRAGEVWFGSGRDAPTTRLTLGIRLGTRGRVRPVLRVEYDGELRGDQLALCGIAPNGTCMQDFPRLSGPATSLGLRGAVSERLHLGVGIGRAWYDRAAHFADVDVAVRVVRRMSATAGLRHTVWTDTAGHRLFSRPFMIGMRVQ